MISTKSKTWIDIPSVLKAVQQGSIQALNKAALLVEIEAKELLNVGGRRKVYVKSKTRKTGERGKKRTRKKFISEPSTAPAPPHAQSGTLRNSIKHSTTTRHTAVVGPTSPPAWYGAVHEFGGAHHAKRPFMRPALMNKRREFPKLFKALRLAATRAGRRLNGSKRPG